jgi:hypothetical protein
VERSDSDGRRFKFALDETGQVVERSILSDHHAERASAVALIEG